MQQLTKLLLLSLLVTLLPSGSIAQKSGSRRRQPKSPAAICNITSVPKGMVVVGYKRSSACSNGNEFVVKVPQNGDIICAESPRPPQVSISAEAQGDAVGTCPTRAFLISYAGPGSASAERTASSADDDAIARAFATRSSNVQVKGEGKVIRLLSDDVSGSRHQRFIVELTSGQTLLITHNTDIAPRIDGLEVGDTVRFNGEYVWNEKAASSAGRTVIRNAGTPQVG